MAYNPSRFFQSSEEYNRFVNWILYRDFLCVIMAHKSSACASDSDKKRMAGDDSASGRERQAISMETKMARNIKYL